MLYFDFEAGNQAYKLRLNTRNTIMLEKAIGCNPLAIFSSDGSSIPTETTMVQILHASMQQYHHGITFDKACDIFDAYKEDGHTTTDFIQVIFGIYKVSGIIRNDDPEGEEKN